MFSKGRSSRNGAANGGPGDPPIAVVQPTIKLSYSTSSMQQDPGPSRGGGAAAGRPGAEAGGDNRRPRLDLPRLETGQSDDQLRDLAYTLFAACAGASTPQHRALVAVVRQQLGVDEGRAADLARVLRHIMPGGDPTLMDSLHASSDGGAGGSSWRHSQRASLELLLHLVAVVRPGEFESKGFKGFLRWKDVTIAVLDRQLDMAAQDSWTGDQAQLRKLRARLHGAARRADVRSESEYDEEEYGEAVRSLAAVAGQVAAGCSTGLRFPWAVRVRLCEILIGALFDTLDEGNYIDEAALVLQFLDSVMWPALGLSPSAATAVSAWVHFSTYVATREQRLVKQLKTQIGKLAAAAAEAAAAPGKPADPFDLGPAAAGGGIYPPVPPPAAELSRDRELAGEVANRIVDFLYQRLCDYHAAFPGGDNLSPLLDVFVFAARSRGDSPPALGRLLTEAVLSSTAAEFGRLSHSRVDMDGSDEARLLELSSIAHDVADAAVATYTPALAQHLPDAMAVASARLYELYGRHLGPWLGKVNSINTAVLDVFRTVYALAQRLDGPVDKALKQLPPQQQPQQQGSPPPKAGAASGGGAGDAAGDGTVPAVVEVLAAHRRWDLATPLQGAMLQWVGGQLSNMNTWVARALQTEKWRPMGAGPGSAHSVSSVEVARMTGEALDALFAMDVPLPAQVPRALLAGMDAVLRKYATHVIDMLGAISRLIPPVPPTTRYKKDVVVKQETAELELARGGKNAKKAVFLASVPTIQSSPDFTNINAGLTTEVIATAACSLAFLAGRADNLLEVSRARQQQSAALHPAVGPVDASPGSSPAGKGAKAEDDDPMAQSRVALQTGMTYACKFLATRIVFWDQRHAWLEQLYRHHVSSCRLDPLLGQLNGVLGAVAGGMPEPVRGAFARQLLGVCVQALERVLLDGGPCRWFVPADVPALEQDLLKLRALFHADGDGLDREAIDGELERVRRLLPLMGTEVGPLLDMVKQARTHGTAQLVGASSFSSATAAPSRLGSAASSSGQHAYDEGTLMRVIARRPEHTGSKLLKTLYKMPKKIK